MTSNFRFAPRHWLQAATAIPTRPKSLALLAIVFSLTACSSDDTTRSGLFEPYRTDLPQGNYVTQDMLDQVNKGMNDREVARALGSPLLRDVFQPRQWNYVFSYRHPNGRIDLRRVRILFDENNQVAAIEADELPRNESPEDPALPGFRKDAY